MAKRRNRGRSYVGGLDAQALTGFNVQKRRVNEAYGLGLAQNRFQKSRTRNEYTRGRRDLVARFGEARRELPGAYAQGGLLNSGLWQKRVADFNAERQRALGSLQGRFREENSGLRLARRQLEQVRRGALDDIKSQRAARRSATASALRSARGAF